MINQARSSLLSHELHSQTGGAFSPEAVSNDTLSPGKTQSRHPDRKDTGVLVLLNSAILTEVSQ